MTVREQRKWLLNCRWTKDKMGGQDVDGGNVLRDLRGRIPKLAGAEAVAKARMAWELIYKLGTTLNGNHPPKL